MLQKPDICLVTDIPCRSVLTLCINNDNIGARMARLTLILSSIFMFLNGSIACPLPQFLEALAKDSRDQKLRGAYLAQNITEAKKVAGSNWLMGLYQQLQSMPDAQIYMIGEEHGLHPYTEIIATFAMAKSKIKMLFLETTSNYNSALKYFYDHPELSYAQVFGNSLSHIPYGEKILIEKTLTLLRDLKIQVVGIEDPATGNTFVQRFNLAQRHQYSSDIILESLEALGHPAEAIYIGGSAHISTEGENALSQGYYKSLPDILKFRGQVLSRKIFLSSERGSPVKLAFDQDPTLALQKPVSFKPSLPAPYVWDQPRGSSLGTFRWSEFDLAILTP